MPPRLVRFVAAATLKSLTPLAGSVEARQQPAFVLPQDGGCVYPFGDGRTVKYWFSNDGTHPWDRPGFAGQMSNFSVGAQRWSFLKSAGSVGDGGAGVVSLFEPQLVSGPGPAVVKVVLDSGTSTASANCTSTPATIRVNPSANGQVMRYYAGHEVGHVYGLRHSGKFDALTTAAGVQDVGATPLMSGCVQPVGPSDIPTSDDWDNVWFKAGGSSSVVGDGGFESASVANFAQAGSVTRDNSYRYAGARSARLAGAATIQHRVRLTQPLTSLGLSTAYKHASAAPLSFKGYARPVSYPAGACNLDSPSTGLWTALPNGSLSQSSNWSVVSLPLSTGWAIYGAVDVDVTVS